MNTDQKPLKYAIQAITPDFVAGKTLFRPIPVTMDAVSLETSAHEAVAMGCALDEKTLAYGVDYFFRHVTEMMALDGAQPRSLGALGRLEARIAGSLPPGVKTLSTTDNGVYLAVRLLPAFRDALAGMPTAYEENATVQAHLTQIYPDSDPTKADCIIGKSAFTLIGKNLTLNAEAADEVISLLALDGSVAVAKATVISAKMGCLNASLPEVPVVGKYMLKVTTRAGQAATADLITLTRKVTVTA